MLVKQYDIIPDAPKAINMGEYIIKSDLKYKALLETEANKEHSFQHFLEENPAYVPGAFEVFGLSGHYPYMNCLITQPRINDKQLRIPDFMWLANDSLSFCPVLIEIEKPSKEQFRKDEINRFEFTQAYNQIIEWKAILSTISGQESFYERFSIDEENRKKEFKPQYILVYGRRSEYEKDEWLRRKRALFQNDDICIMSFDRLHASRDVYDLVTCTVSNGQYYVRYIPPTFVYRPVTSHVLQKWIGFTSALSRIPDISEERRVFLQNRFEYWMCFGAKKNHGIMNSGDYE